MFWKTSLDQSSVILPPFTHFFPPLPQINVGYFDDPSSCNTEITFFNIDMGVGGEISPYIPEKLKTCFFQKFLHTIVVTPHVPTSTLRSADQSLLFLQKFKLKTFGARSFHITVLILWNSMPLELMITDSCRTFKKHLKTRLLL